MMAPRRKKTKSPPTSAQFQEWINAGMCELEYDKKGQPKQLVVNFPDGTQGTYAILDKLVSILKDSGLALSKEKVERLPVKLTPSLTNKFKGRADDVDVNFSEYVRRALFAAEVNPDSLFSDDVNEKELAYKRGLNSSRWTKSLLDNLPAPKK